MNKQMLLFLNNDIYSSLKLRLVLFVLLRKKTTLTKCDGARRINLSRRKIPRGAEKSSFVKFLIPALTEL